MAWSAQPSIHEVNTWVWLGELGRRTGRPVDLAQVPADAWDAVCVPGVDAVWLMGVWTRSPAAAAVFRADAGAVAHYRSILPDYTDADAVGSAYAVRDYTVDPTLGGDAGLAAARAELDRRGCALVLDYVPNHTAPDHPWLTAHPERYLRGSPDELAADPVAFLEADGGTIVARGRDPYFPPWPDVAQLDLFAPGTRDAAVETLRAIGDRADGVRCDMAMLALTDVFRRTWGAPPAHAPSGEFWEQVVGALRNTHPNLVLLAEAYWGTEDTLVAQGFDACYDKELYDRLVHGDVAGVRAHIARDHANHTPRVRFVENHDEPRAADAFGGDAGFAAAVVVATLPGTTLWHEGQFDGRRIHVPVILGRRPDEPLDTGGRARHLALVEAASRVRRGAWRPVDTSGWTDNPSHEQLLAWTWTSTASRSIVVVNLSERPAQGLVHPRWLDLDASVMLVDELTGARFERSRQELADGGLYVDLPPWGAHVLVATS
jgi:hypothetical protein